MLMENQPQANCTPSDVYRVILLGKTGGGKSSVANKLAGQVVFEESNRMESCTNDIHRKVVKFRNNDSEILLEVVDTPGFLDSNGDDQRNMIGLCKFLKEIKDGFNIVLFCFSALEMRMDEGL